MNVTADAGPDAFAAELARDTSDWGRAKALAFERLREAFPDPDGPPEWALRQIVRGQFDRRLPAAWRPAFIEVFHQWLGFAAEREEARGRRPGTRRWWREASPRWRKLQWLGGAASPMAAVLLVLVALGARLAVVLPQLRAMGEDLQATREAASHAMESSLDRELRTGAALVTEAKPDFDQVLAGQGFLDWVDQEAAAEVERHEAASLRAEELLRRTRFPRW